MKFAVFVPNSRKLSLILAKLVHKLRTHSDAKNTLREDTVTAEETNKVISGIPTTSSKLTASCLETSLLMHSEWLSSRTSFQLKDEVLDTSEPLFGSVQTPNIIVFILVLYANRVEGSLGHFQTLIWKCPMLQFSQIFPLFLIFGS